MIITREFGAYNHRRYGRPWIAVVTDWPVGEQPTLRFGGLLGPANGSAVTAEIEANPEQILRWGQKDFRGRGTVNGWGIIESDGTVRVTDAKGAREFLRARGE